MRSTYLVVVFLLAGSYCYFEVIRSSGKQVPGTRHVESLCLLRGTFTVVVPRGYAMIGDTKEIIDRYFILGV